MAHTKVTKTHSQNTGVANTFSYSGSFDVFKGSEVVVLLDGIALTLQAGTIDESASPREYTVDTTAKTVHIGGADLSSGIITIRPETDLGNPTPRATYAPGASVTSEDLNNNQLQLMRKAMEYNEQKLASTGGTMTGDLHLGQNVNLTFEGSAEDDHETTLTVANPTSDKTITLPDTTGTVITTGDTGTVTSTMINDGTIVNADVNASAAIAGTKISPDFGSQNIATTGTINNLTTTELAILDGATVSTAELNKLDGVTASTSEINILDGVTSTTTELNILDGVTASTAEINKLDGVTASTSELNILDGVTATTTELNIIDGVTATTTELNYVDGVTSGIQAQIDGKQPLDSELTELATMGSGTADALADLNSAEVQTLDGITASTAELNLLDGKSIVTTISGSATDVQIPSAQAVNERIVEVVTEVGGFVPITNETSFPTTNPDINDGAGTIVSIKALASNLTSNGSGVATIANGAGSGNTVTINGMANSDTIEAGKGILVETTTTLHTYTFHREVIDPAGVTNAQTLVNDFNDRYQISGSAPSNHPDGSALQDGDLWFDTSSNIMKVYDLGNTQYDAVTSVGDFKLLTVVPDGATSGSPTFDGNIVSYDLRDGSNAANVTSVGQLLVSLNGVIQKPNSGSYNASNEGFYLEGANGIKFCTAPASGASLFVTLIGAATSIGTPNDNTVSEAKLQSDAVSEAKLKVSNSPVNGYFLQAQSGNTGGLTWAQVDLASKFSKAGGDTITGDFTIASGTTNKNINVDVSDKVRFDDNLKATFGSSDDLQIYHDGSHSYVSDEGTGSLIVTTNGTGIYLQKGTTETFAKFLADGAVELNYNDTKKFETTSAGVTVTGTVAATSFTGDGSNLTGLQAGATGGNSGANAIFWENQQTVTHDYSISANRNAGSFGPITINSGITVTVPSTSNWTIV
jgi:hypothetical protein